MTHHSVMTSSLLVINLKNCQSETIVNSLITFRLDYCSSLLHGSPHPSSSTASLEQCIQTYIQCLPCLLVIPSSYQPPLAAR